MQDGRAEQEGRRRVAREGYEGNSNFGKFPSESRARNVHILGVINCFFIQFSLILQLHMLPPDDA